DVGVLRLGSDPAALAAADRVPVIDVDAAAAPARGDGDGGVVLLRAVDPVREAVVGRDSVELCGRLVHDRGPGPPAVEGDVGAAVVGIDHPVGVVRVDPEVVVVAVRDPDGRVGPAAVVGAVAAGVEDIDRFGVLRVGVDPRVVPGALAQAVLGVDARPLLAAV